MKVVAICGSARKNGNTEALLGAVLDGAKKAGAETELITLCDKTIKMCDGCCYCDEAKACHIHDDMAAIFAELTRADAIVFGSPTYWDNVSGLLKNFFDRMNAFSSERPLKGKRATAIAVGAGGEPSTVFAVEAMKRFINAQKMAFSGAVEAKAYAPGDIKKDHEAIAKAHTLGERLVKG